jgi:Putative beta-barrel porin-2, OmpL-like. bbp2
MIKHAYKLAGGTAAILTLAATAFADIKLNDNLTVNGWATGSYQYTKYSPGTSSDSFNVDAAEFSAVVTPVVKGPVTATFSLYFRPAGEGGVSPGGSELTLLDAYVTYDAGNGVTFTAGKFLSYLGYESFYLINDNMITLANQQFLAPIPGYHEGIRMDYTPNKTSTLGIALVDSLFQKPGYAATQGDGEFKHSGAFEAYWQYTGVDGLTLWTGLGYSSKVKPGTDTSGVLDPSGHTVAVYDLWASYAFSDKKSTLALEEIYKDGGIGNKGSNWLIYFQYAFSEKGYIWLGVSGEDVSSFSTSDGEEGFIDVSGPKYTKYSVSPTWVITPNLSFRLQYSYTKYNNFSANDANFIGAQVLFKF